MRLLDGGKLAVNALARMFGVRVVNSQWGPRGAFDALRRTKAQGVAPALVLDIGAASGEWTRECIGIFPDAHYVLAEPLPRNWERLSATVRRGDRMSLWKGAVGSGEDRVQLFCHGDQSSVFGSRDFMGPGLLVEMTTVDSLFERQQMRAPVLLKADVQGYELEVLGGASRCLQSTELLLLEVSFQHLYDAGALAHEIISFLGERGFRIYDICSYLQRPADRALAQADLLFARHDSRLFARQGWS